MSALWYGTTAAPGFIYARTRKKTAWNLAITLGSMEPAPGKPNLLAGNVLSRNGEIGLGLTFFFFERRFGLNRFPRERTQLQVGESRAQGAGRLFDEVTRAVYRSAHKFLCMRAQYHLMFWLFSSIFYFVFFLVLFFFFSQLSNLFFKVNVCLLLMNFQ